MADASPPLALAVPHTGSVSVRWAVRLAELEGPPHHIVTKSTAAVDLARELTVEEALDFDPEWVLFLDADVIPPRDVFTRLRKRDVDVISGLYYADTRECPHPAMWRPDDEGSPAPGTRPPGRRF